MSQSLAEFYAVTSHKKEKKVPEQNIMAAVYTHVQPYYYYYDYKMYW